METFCGGDRLGAGVDCLYRAVLQIADFITGIHVLIDLVFYVVAGLVWIPLAGRVVGWLA